MTHVTSARTFTTKRDRGAHGTQRIRRTDDTYHNYQFFALNSGRLNIPKPPKICLCKIQI